MLCVYIDYLYRKNKNNLTLLWIIYFQIPADLVVNCVITTIAVHLDQDPNKFIYHISSSLRNPFKISDLINITYDYFVKKPWIDANGKPIVTSKRLWLTSLDAFNNYMMFRYVMPLKVCQM